MKQEIRPRIGDTIRQFREKQNLSLTQLSKLSGIQVATLSRIENDKMAGTLEAHARIAQTLGIELYELYKDVKLPKKTDKTPTYSGLG